MSLMRQAMRDHLHKLREAKRLRPDPYASLLVLPGSHNPSKRVYDKPSKTQAEARALKLAIELKEEEKLLKEQLSDGWD